VWAWFDPLIAALATCSIALLVYFGGRGVITAQISLGQFVAFSSYLGMFAWPMIAVGIVVNMMQRGAASMQRILTILDTPPAIVSGAVDDAVQPACACRALTFRYHGVDSDALTDVSFALPPGHVLGIVGRTGAGKTTLVELLMRLYEPPPASVFMDGHDVRTLHLERVRGLFGYVAQEPFLFSMSVADNIRFGRPDLAHDAIVALAKAVRLHDEIVTFPEGYDTLVGERGITLSGGQKQRVAIARALALRPAVLVLDDALSSVDAETETAILAYLRANMQRTSMIVIAHRISAVRDADLILVLDRGRVVDRGTHAALVQREGFYSEVYRLQTLEAMLGAGTTLPA
jgi:ATP-binding cassette subfamily B protein